MAATRNAYTLLDMVSYLKTVFHEGLRVEEAMKKYLSGRHGNLKARITHIRRFLISTPVSISKINVRHFVFV